MKILKPVISGIVWTGVLLALYRTPIGTQGADWRLPIFLILSWCLGMLLMARITAGRPVDPSKGILLTVDESTGIANRRAFAGHVEPLLKAAVTFDEKSLVVILNINDLDRVIEEDGDDEAEKTVIHVAQAFMDSLRGSDILARYDKDELVAFLPKASLVFSEIVTDRIMMNLAKQSRSMDNPRNLNVSVGFAQFDPVAPQSLDYLIRQAYRNMIESMGEMNSESENPYSESD